MSTGQNLTETGCPWPTRTYVQVTGTLYLDLRDEVWPPRIARSENRRGRKLLLVPSMNVTVRRGLPSGALWPRPVGPRWKRKLTLQVARVVQGAAALGFAVGDDVDVCSRVRAAQRGTVRPAPPPPVRPPGEPDRDPRLSVRSRPTPRQVSDLARSRVGPASRSTEGDGEPRSYPGAASAYFVKTIFPAVSPACMLWKPCSASSNGSSAPICGRIPVRST